MKKIYISILIFIILLTTGCSILPDLDKEKKEEEPNKPDKNESFTEEITTCTYNQNPYYTLEKITIETRDKKVIRVTEDRLINVTYKDQIKTYSDQFYEIFKNNKLITSKNENNEWIITTHFGSMNLEEYSNNLYTYYINTNQTIPDMSYLENGKLSIYDYKEIYLYGYSCTTKTK